MEIKRIEIQGRNKAFSVDACVYGNWAEYKGTTFSLVKGLWFVTGCTLHQDAKHLDTVFGNTCVLSKGTNFRFRVDFYTRNGKGFSAGDSISACIESHVN